MQPESNPPFPDMHGKLGALVRKHDWSATPLGPIDTWPPVLLSVVSLILASPFPQCLMIGAEMTVIYNDAYETLLDSKPLVLGWPVRDIWPDLWPAIGPLLQRTRAGEIVYAEDRPFEIARHGHVETAWFTFGYSPVRDEKGQVFAVLNTSFETSEKVRAIGAAEAAGTDKAEFVSYLNHNLRSPLGAISGLAGLLAASEPLTADQREYVRVMQLSTESVFDQLRDLIDTARIGTRAVTLERTAFSLAALAGDIIDPLAEQARAKGLSFTTEIDGEAGDMMGDVSRLRQIIRLLCGNAIKFTEEGGVNLNLASTATGELTIIVSDSGPGIVPEQRDTLFAPASGEKSRYGARMGLTIARTLTELMGGTIAVTSQPGEGATFTVTVPLTAAEPPRVEAPEAPEVSIPEMTPVADASAVLLVEDYEPNVLVATTILQQLGYTVDVARHGAAAVARAGASTYLFAVMDVQMPGMNGFEATQAIRDSEAATGRTRLPVIGVTAHSLAGDRERCLAAGMDEYLPKPFTAAELARKIQVVLNAEPVDHLLD